jgi:hypothetical protein
MKIFNVVKRELFWKNKQYNLNQQEKIKLLTLGSIIVTLLNFKGGFTKTNFILLPFSELN